MVTTESIWFEFQLFQQFLGKIQPENFNETSPQHNLEMYTVFVKPI